MFTRLNRFFIKLACRAHLKPRTVRLRLTLLYGGLIFVSGALLLTINYFLLIAGTRDLSMHISPGPGPLPPLTPEQAQAVSRALTQILRQQSEIVQQIEHHYLLLASGIALAIMTIVGMVLGWLIAGRVLRPLRAITSATREISEKNLHQRLALGGPKDEMRDLGDTIDGLLARLEAAFEAQRRFVANASHELRSPLARERTLIQVALGDPDADVESLRRTLERVLVAGEQQERLIDALLALARGQAGPGNRESIDLAKIAEQVLVERQRDAELRGVAVQTNLLPAPVVGEPRLVARLVSNLLENAIRHNLASGGRVEVRTDTKAGRAILSIENTGPPVPSDAVEEIFQPFRRLGSERLSHGEGLGLGLSIVHAIATAHGATVTARPRPEGGLEIEVVFPDSSAPN